MEKQPHGSECPPVEQLHDWCLSQNNWPSKSDVCIMNEDFMAIAVENQGWEWRDEGKPGRPKLGYVATQPGAQVQDRQTRNWVVPMPTGQKERLLGIPPANRTDLSVCVCWGVGVRVRDKQPGPPSLRNKPQDLVSVCG
jgi:hypothetical protein